MKKLALLLTALLCLSAAQAQFVLGLQGGYYSQKETNSLNDDYTNVASWLGGAQLGYQITPRIYVGVAGNYHNNSTEWFKDIDTFFYEQVGLWINAHDHKRTTSRSGWSVSPMVKYEVVRFGQMHFNLLLQGTIRSMGVTKYTESYVTPTFPNPGEYRDVNPWDDATTLFSWGVSLRPTIVYEFSTHISAELSLDLLSIGYVNSTITYTPAEAALDPIKSTTATLYAGLNSLTQPLEWEPALVKLGFNYTF